MTNKQYVKKSRQMKWNEIKQTYQICTRSLNILLHNVFYTNHRQFQLNLSDTHFSLHALLSFQLVDFASGICDAIWENPSDVAQRHFEKWLEIVRKLVYNSVELLNII